MNERKLTTLMIEGPISIKWWRKRPSQPTKLTVTPKPPSKIKQSHRSSQLLCAARSSLTEPSYISYGEFMFSDIKIGPRNKNSLSISQRICPKFHNFPYDQDISTSILWEFIFFPLMPRGSQIFILIENSWGFWNILTYLKG